MKTLNEAHVPSDITLENVHNFVGHVLATNAITFTDDELPPEGTGHNKALYFKVKCKDMIVARVLVENGSALHICPLITFQTWGWIRQQYALPRL